MIFIIKNKFKFLFPLLLFGTNLIYCPSYADDSVLQNSLKITVGSSELHKMSFTPVSKKKIVGLSTRYEYNNLITQFSMNKAQNNTLNFDKTFIEYDNKRIKIGFGSVSRQWSFSPNTFTNFI